MDVNLGVAIVALCVAAFAGNVTGYEIGRAIGTPLYQRDGRVLKKKYFDQTTAFFDKHGNKARHRTFRADRADRSPSSPA